MSGDARFEPRLNGLTQEPLADHALIGNCRTAALVARSGRIDWCCLPRFDSPAALCQLLDAERGGHFTIQPTAAFTASRRYEPDTNILQTDFSTDTGSVRVVDFMPLWDAQAKPFPPNCIVRRVSGLEGSVALRMTFRPSFDFARARARMERSERGVVAQGEGFAEGGGLSVRCPEQPEVCGDTARAELEVLPGDGHWFVLTHGTLRDATGALARTPEELEAQLCRTRDHWRRWSARCQYVGPYEALVRRSALTLELLTHEASGAVIAAPTTSLPADLGGVRNWDYRYVWLRDAGLTLDALQLLGYHKESKHFIDWFEHAVPHHQALAAMYTIDGEPVPDERQLDHLSGYRRSRPVRIGNDARHQTQTDNLGHVLDAVVLCYERMPREMTDKHWAMIRRLANRAAKIWSEPGNGPWEIRGPKRHYLYSKLYSWVGLDRTVRFAERHGLSGELEEWRAQRDAIRRAILEKGYHRSVGAFTQAFDGEVLDATALVLPLTGLLSPDDPRVQSTLEQVQERLTRNGLVYRYTGDDGLVSSDKTFTLCSFWLVMLLAAVGRTQEAQELFEYICSHASDVGLLSEQIDPDTGELLGNFPQGFTHLGLIRAALWLGGKHE